MSNFQMPRISHISPGMSVWSAYAVLLAQEPGNIDTKLWIAPRADKGEHPTQLAYLSEARGKLTVIGHVGLQSNTLTAYNCANWITNTPWLLDALKASFGYHCPGAVAAR